MSAGEAAAAGPGKQRGENGCFMSVAAADYVVDLGTGCWLWLRGLTAAGYAEARIDGRTVLVHRAIYQATFGAIPDGQQVHHVCHVRHCINPAHLLSKTPIEHSAAHKAIRTHCPQGHPYDSANTGGSGSRIWCRACARERERIKRVEHPKPRTSVHYYFGEDHHQHKLTVEQVREIRRQYGLGGVAQKQLALRYGVAPGTIQAIVERRTWRAIE